MERSKIGIYSNTRTGLTRFATGRHNIFCVFRKEADRCSPNILVIPVAHKISPNHELQLLDSVSPRFLCCGCITIPTSFLPTYFRTWHYHDICHRHCSCFVSDWRASSLAKTIRLCIGFHGRHEGLLPKAQDKL